MVASLVGGAILLFSCSGKKVAREVNMETMITQQSDTLSIVYTKNGVKEHRMSTPLMERYEFARDPYMEFRYGITVTTFDSLGRDNSKLRGDYAIFYEKRELWEVRGNVVGEGADGRTLYTQQLFWDQKTDKIYSNVDCRIVDGNDEFVGEGFESDSEFKEWVFRESEGRMWVDASQSENPTPRADGEVDEEAAKDKNYRPTEPRDEDVAPRSIMEQEERRREAERRRRTPAGRRSKGGITTLNDGSDVEMAPGKAPVGKLAPDMEMAPGKAPMLKTPVGRSSEGGRKPKSEGSEF